MQLCNTDDIKWRQKAALLQKKKNHYYALQVYD